MRNEKLLEFGPATKVPAHEFCARKPHDRAKRAAAKDALERPPVLFSGVQARAVARGFAARAERSNVTVWACAVLSDHAHLVIAAHRLDIETLANFFKGDSTLRLTEESAHPFQGQKGWKGRVPTCWGRKWWTVYKSDEAALVNAIRYVERNPLKAGLPAQKWSFVSPYPQLRAPKVKGAEE